MIIIKLIVGIGIIGTCTYIGILKSKTYGDRIDNLKTFRQGLAIFKTKISFTAEPIKEIFRQIATLVYKNPNNIFLELSKYNRKSNEIGFDEYFFEIIEKEKGVTNEDKDAMKTLGKLLGTLDKEGQISQIDLCANFIDRQIEEAEAEKAKYSKLYRTIGMSAGCAITIVLF